MLGTLPVEVGLPRLLAMRDDSDERVVPAVLASLAALRAPDAVAIVSERLKTGDAIVRAAAASALAKLKAPAGPALLAEAYRTGGRTRHTWPVARR